MKVNWKEHKNKIGIYCIINVQNQKKYIGKSINIAQRIANHVNGLNKESKDENRFLINSWNKYGKDNFYYIILEEFETINESKIKERELFWMDTYSTTNSKFGYNLRRDSSTKMIVHEDTIKLVKGKFSGEKNPNFGKKWTEEMKLELSKKLKKQFSFGLRTTNIENTKKAIQVRNNNWINNPELKIEMAKKVSEKRKIYSYEKYDKEGNLLFIYNSVFDILKENPSYKRHNIYAVCSGEKPSIYGFVWKKKLINDKVQTELKDSE